VRHSGAAAVLALLMIMLTTQNLTWVMGLPTAFLAAIGIRFIARWPAAIQPVHQPLQTHTSGPHGTILITAAGVLKMDVIMNTVVIMDANIINIKKVVAQVIVDRVIRKKYT